MASSIKVVKVETIKFFGHPVWVGLVEQKVSQLLKKAE